ncbi:putative ribonuclease H-like domain-containing protein [Tanacetum coccineum]
MDVKSAFLYRKIEEEVYVCQPPGFEDPDFPDRVYKVEKALYGLHQALRAWYETLSTYLLDNGFQRGKIDKTLFIRRVKSDILSMGELTFFLGLQVKQKEDGIFISQDKYVTEILKKFGFTDVKTANTPIVCRPRYQVNLKVSHLHVVKRIFRYLKGQPTIWALVSKKIIFCLVAYTDSDYAGASLDRKSTTGGIGVNASDSKLMLLGINLLLLVFWDTVKAKTVNGEVQLQALVDKKKLTLIGYEKLSQKLTFYKAFFSPQWKFLIHTILQCLSAKTTAWNEFSSTMASAIIYLATNQKFNFSKYIFDNMVKNVDSMVQFWMYPRFVQVFVNKQVGDMSHHKRIYVTPSHTKKIFGNMKRGGKGFSGRVTPLFQSMMVQAHEEMGKGSEIPTDPHYIPIITQPSSSQPQRKQKSRKSKKKNTEVPQPSGSTDNVPDENVPTTSNDPLLSGEDRLKLTELMDLCTNLQKKVLDLEKAKECQVVKFARLKKKTLGGRNDDNLRFDTSVLDEQEVEIEKVASTAEVTTEIKAAKPKVRGVMIQEPSEFTTTTPTASKPSHDKGKAKMIESEKPLKKKDQIMYDQEVALNLQAQLQAELEEEERITRQKEEEASIALIESWDNTQEMIDVDYQMAQ